ncbi:unnamed protein product, partial [Choristocarpus tenellus]
MTGIRLSWVVASLSIVLNPPFGSQVVATATVPNLVREGACALYNHGCYPHLGSNRGAVSIMQFRGGGGSGGVPGGKEVDIRGGASKSKENRDEGKAQQGRASNALILSEAVVDTAIGTGLILGALYLSQLGVNKVPEDLQDSLQLLTWVALVFLSGLATTGPRNFLQKSQLFRIEAPLENGWYDRLKKPWFNPPNWVFPIMWIPLKILQVWACYDMWMKLGEKRVLAQPVVVFALYKSLGDVWNKVFFVRRRLALGTLVIGIYWLTLIAG